MLLEELIEFTTLYVDMDGVIADFEQGMSSIMNHVIGEPYVEDRYQKEPEYQKKMWKCLEEYQQEKGPIVWRDLPLMSDAKELWKYLEQTKVNIEILSATGKPQYQADKQKRIWFKRHFNSTTPMNFVRKAAEKAKYACKTCILIDDKDKAINPWRKSGGTGIIHTSAKQTIAQLKNLGV